MKQFLTIFKFEFTAFLKNKVFVGVTLFLMALLAALLFLPRIKGAISGNPGETPGSHAAQQEGEAEDGTYHDPVALLAGSYVPEIKDALAQRLGYQIKEGPWSGQEIRQQIQEGEASIGLLFDQPEHFTYFVGNVSMFDESGAVLEEAITNVLKLVRLKEQGLGEQEASALLNLQVSHDMEVLGKNEGSYYWHTYLMIMALYMALILYGQLVATNVASEKSSRAMELLITSARPAALLFGKVLAACAAGILQLGLIFGSATLFYQLNQEYWQGNAIMSMLFPIPTSLLLYMLLFFLLGFFLYAMLYGAIGSTATKVEDINTSVMPITMLFMVAFFVVVFSISSPAGPDSPLMKVASFVPFTSPMAMFARIAMSTVPPVEIVISVVILAASVLGVGFLAARIYRLGVLMYGQPPKVSSLLKMIRQK